MSRLQLAIDQIVFARNYTLGLLNQTCVEDWFRQPAAGVSHIGWQVGHLALAEFRMALWRIRGPLPKDDALVSPDLIRLSGAQSAPEADPAKYPTGAQIRAVLDRVHEHVLQELPGLADVELDQPVPKPHRFANTKLKALLWCRPSRDAARRSDRAPAPSARLSADVVTAIQIRLIARPKLCRALVLARPIRRSIAVALHDRLAGVFRIGGIRRRQFA